MTMIHQGDAGAGCGVDDAGRRSTLVSTAAACLSIVLPFGSHAQDAYPSKTIKVVVPFPAGGGGDTLARLVLTPVGPKLGQTIVFENVAGAGGNIGSAAAARADPDGYTLLYGTNGTLGINQTLYRNPGYDVLKDFRPITRLTELGLVAVVRPNFPAASMPELLKLLKSNPGKYTFGSAGNGTTSHLAMELLKSRLGLAVVHIPYRGGAPAMTDLIGGQVDMMIEVMPNAVPHVKSGRLKALAVTTAKRTETLPDVPTMIESGVADFVVTAWDAVVVPAGTPDAVVGAVNKAVHSALGDPEVVRQLALRGAWPSPTTPEELGRFVRSEVKRWGAAVKRSGASVD